MDGEIQPAVAGAPSSASFNFVSSWALETSRKTVWDALFDFRSWPEWWPGLEEIVALKDGDESGLGQKASSRWRGPIGYRFRFTVEAVELREPELLRGQAAGDLSGSGTWHLHESGGWTDVRLEWLVDANRKWMEFLAPVARPVFVHGHDHVMKEGAHGLASHLGVGIRDFTSTA
jgi:uncharacterized protein YndB with AHSA1/START domain